MGIYRVIQLDESLGAIGELGRIRSISLDRSMNDKSSLLESCSVVFDLFGDFAPGWYQIQHIDGDRQALGVFRLERDGLKANHGVATVTAKGYSVLKPAEEITMPTGSYAPAGRDGVAFVADLLKVCPGRIETYGTAALQAAIVFDDNASHLEAAWNVLDAIGYRLRLDGNGNIYIEPMPEDYSMVVNTETVGNLVPGLDVTSEEVRITRTYDDSLRPGDRVSIVLPQYGIEREGRVKSQSFAVGAHLQITDCIGEVRSDRG